jgi:hypothetical protein
MMGTRFGDLSTGPVKKKDTKPKELPYVTRFGILNKIGPTQKKSRMLC